MVRRSQRKEKSVIQYDPMPSYLSDMKTRLVQPGHSDDQDSPTDFGRLQFSLQYDIEDNKLYVSVLQCTQLLKNVPGRLPDPYVKVYLHPDMKPVYETTHETNTIHPRFDSTFCFTARYEMMGTKSIVFVVYNFSNKRKAVRLGQATKPLDGVDLTQCSECWLDLDTPDNSLEDELGHLCLSLATPLLRNR